MLDAFGFITCVRGIASEDWLSVRIEKAGL